MSSNALTTSGSVGSLGSAGGSTEDVLSVSMSRPYNQRIDLLGDEDGEDDFYVDDMAELDDDELTRDKVKRASAHMLREVERKRRKPKKKGGPAQQSGRLDSPGTANRSP
jgi:hypothetical protein